MRHYLNENPLLPDISVEDGCVISGEDGQRGWGQSAVISVMAARAEVSSTMFFLVA